MTPAKSDVRVQYIITHVVHWLFAARSVLKAGTWMSRLKININIAMVLHNPPVSSRQETISVFIREIGLGSPLQL
jgi:hypothetical protein